VLIVPPMPPRNEVLFPPGMLPPDGRVKAIASAILSIYYD